MESWYADAEKEGREARRKGDRYDSNPYNREYPAPWGKLGNFMKESWRHGWNFEDNQIERWDQ